MTRLIYIVDDDEELRESLVELLTTEPDTTIQTFASGDEFLAAAQTLQPGVLLLDFAMPGSNGLEVLDQLVSRHARFVPVMITAHENAHIAVKALQAGACDFLEKPYEFETLQAILDIAFDKLAEISAEPS